MIHSSVRRRNTCSSRTFWGHAFIDNDVLLAACVLAGSQRVRTHSLIHVEGEWTTISPSLLPSYFFPLLSTAAAAATAKRAGDVAWRAPDVQFACACKFWTDLLSICM